MLELFEAAVALRRQSERLASVGGETHARFQLLGVLSDGDATVPAIARELGLTRQSVQRVADMLLSEGSIVALPNPDHARSPLMHLTDAGREASAPVVAAAGEWHTLVAARLHRDDVDAARRVVRSLIEAVD